MEVKDVAANQGKIDLVLDVISKEEPRTFEKFGKEGRVCNATGKDETGEIKLTLWNEDVDKVTVGSKIHVQNGWCSEYKGEKQLSSGKFGSIEVVGEAKAQEAAPEVFTNSPEMLGQAGMEENPLEPQPTKSAGDEEVDLVSEEEFVE